MTAWKNPDPQNIIQQLNNALKQKQTIIIIGSCTVDYHGRATSTLELGDRVILIKPDGTTLVHTSSGNQPINWQPPGSSSQITIDNGLLKINTTRKHPQETITIKLYDLHYIIITSLKDINELVLFGSESQMRDQIVNEPTIIRHDLKIIKKELATKYGIIDIFGEYTTTNELIVIELKRHRANLDSVSQLNRYVSLKRQENPNQTIHGLLIAPSITPNAKNLLEHTYKYKFKKIKPPNKLGTNRE